MEKVAFAVPNPFFRSTYPTFQQLESDGMVEYDLPDCCDAPDCVENIARAE